MAKKILIIDDDQEFVAAVANLLETKGYEVESAPNGKEGLRKAKAFPPQAILLDVMMTHKSEGFDVARQLRGDKATAAIPASVTTWMAASARLYRLSIAPRPRGRPASPRPPHRSAA